MGFSYAQNKEFEKGIALFKKQNFAEAIDFFKTARQKNEKAYLPIKYLAKSFQEIRDFENSELYYVLTVNSDSVQVEDYLYYSQALKANGKLLEAKIQFAKYLELSDKYTTGKYQFLGRVFKKLPGDYTEQVLIYLSNKDGLVLDSILTNRFGYFYFENLSNKEDYLIQLKKADSQINLVLENEFGRIYEVINPDREGVYKVSKTIDASLKTTEAKYNSSTSIIARIEHGGEGLKVFKVNIYNNANQIIGTVYTNNRGEFQFNKLEPKSIYFLEFPDLDEKKLFESMVYSIDVNGDLLYLINQLKDGKFTFNALPFEEYRLIQEQIEQSVPQIITIAGQVYKKLKGDLDKLATVYILDNDGLLLDSVLTDARGNFEFRKLRSDNKYIFKVKDSSKALNMVFLDEDNRILEVATFNINGFFSYDKLTYQIAKFEPITLEDIQQEDVEITPAITGLVYKKLPGDFKSKIKVFIYNGNGELLGEVETDISGRFTFEKLKNGMDYNFKIEYEDEPFQLVTIDKNNRVIDKTIKNKYGQFKYTSLSMDNNEILLAKVNEHQQLDIDVERKNLEGVTVHYQFDSSEIEPAERLTLKNIIREYKDEKSILEVNSYTDNRGAQAYNIQLSKQRTDNVISYLIKNGYPREKVVGNYSGTLNPIVDCKTKSCSKEDHYLNRRTEFKLLKTTY